MTMLDSPFWNFSLALYQEPVVAETCLALQDRYGVDVNLLLYALWRGTYGEALDADAIARLEALTAPWRDEVVHPLRALRRRLKLPVGDVAPEAVKALRAQIAATELLAEQIEQATLFQRSQASSLDLPRARRVALALANLSMLLQAKVASPEDDAQSMVEIFSAALAAKL